MRNSDLHQQESGVGSQSLQSNPSSQVWVRPALPHPAHAADCQGSAYLNFCSILPLVFPIAITYLKDSMLYFLSRWYFIMKFDLSLID